MHANRSVNVHQFAMVPRADIPRSSFRMQHVHKTAFNASVLLPIYVNEMLPGDTFNMRVNAFCRLATPLFPTMDNLHLDMFFFFVPYRLVWDNWERFMGAQDDPSSSTSYVIPQMPSPVNGYTIGSLQDYMGLPTVGQVGAGESTTNSALPLRAYNLIWNEWFRDQNLQNSLLVNMDDGPDVAADYVMKRRGKRHDYFTSCLPWLQKGTSVTVPLGGTAPVIGWSADNVVRVRDGDGNLDNMVTAAASADVVLSSAVTAGGALAWPTGTTVGTSTGLVTDLSAATASTINQLRQSFQIQKLLERDARGGTRYAELIRAHFGVVSPDARLQRPEYLGGGSVPVSINPVAQTSATAASGTDTPQGNLAAIGTVVSMGNGFSYSSTEHGVVIGLANVRADLTYQQGQQRFWNRSTRYDFYFPVFAALGEQAVLRKEIFAGGGPASDATVFGYQERWAEYRYFPSLLTGLMRSTAAQTIDPWHYSEEFATAPSLNTSFIEDKTYEVLERATAVGSEAAGQQLIGDFFFDCRAARPMPLYSVPGFIDHF